MTRFLLIMLLLTTSVVAAPQQQNRPPLSKDEVMDLLISRTPVKVMVSTIRQYGIAFPPTPQVLEEFRKAGAPPAVLVALREAWHEPPPKPLTEREISMLLAGDAPSENIARLVQERGIDFRPTGGYLAQLRAQGAKEALIDVLSQTSPRPFSEEELLQQLRSGDDQERLAAKVRERAIDFDASPQNLAALRTAGAQTLLLEAVRAARRAKPFVAQALAIPVGAGRPLVGHRPATLLCGPGDSDVPVFDISGNLGNIIAHLRCGAQITFVEKVNSPPGFDRIQFGDGKEGVISNAYLELPIATPGGGCHGARSHLQTQRFIYPGGAA